MARGSPRPDLPVFGRLSSVLLSAGGISSGAAFGSNFGFVSSGLLKLIQKSLWPK